MSRLRTWFFTGLIIAGPIWITLYLAWSIIIWVDDWVKPYIPDSYNPDTYLPFALPGFGLLLTLALITFVGFLTASFLGRWIVGLGEGVVNSMPIVRNVYQALKQIFETILMQREQSFRNAVIIEYPRKGLWALAFVATSAKEEVAEKLEDSQKTKGEEMLAVFLPTTPNPTSGFLLFVPKKDIIYLDMTIEEAAKLVISAGLVVPERKITDNAHMISVK